MDYSVFIEKTRLIENVESTTTTGDVQYKGTALEICGPKGEELFHFVVDDLGRKQILVFNGKENYRLPLELMERIIYKAKEVVKSEIEL